MLATKLSTVVDEVRLLEQNHKRKVEEADRLRKEVARLKKAKVEADSARIGKEAEECNAIAADATGGCGSGRASIGELSREQCCAAAHSCRAGRAAACLRADPAET